MKGLAISLIIFKRKNIVILFIKTKPSPRLYVFNFFFFSSFSFYFLLSQLLSSLISPHLYFLFTSVVSKNISLDRTHISYRCQNRVMLTLVRQDIEASQSNKFKQKFKFCALVMAPNISIPSWEIIFDTMDNSPKLLC